MFDLYMASMWVKLNRFIVCVDLYLAPNHHHQLSVVDNYLKVIRRRVVPEQTFFVTVYSSYYASHGSFLKHVNGGAKTGQYWKFDNDRF